MRRLLILLSLMVGVVSLCGGAAGETLAKQKNKGGKYYIFRFTLKDKQGTTGRLEQPQKFLSYRSIERRKRQGLPLDSTDLPVSKRYLKMLDVRGTQIIGTSRWNNTVLLRTNDIGLVSRLDTMSFVERSQLVWTSPDSVFPPSRRERVRESFNGWDSVPTSRYAASEKQIRAINGLKLHEQGFTGHGVCIAVLDGGFKNADRIPALRNAKIEGSKDFIYPNSPSLYQETDHGTKVLSVLAAYAPHVFIGTAPDATYWLLRCEDQQSEQLVEEDYWAMAAEFADSAGVDVINSSLGYNEFDDHSTDHEYWEMDGHTALISRTASMLAKKGIVLVNSAGNNGMGPWKKISFPADADDILAVGAVTPEGRNAPFCGVGPTQDGRVKPDVMAVGSPATVITGRGTLVQDMGTSFASPLVCGMVACLWQALPNKTATEIMELVRGSGSNSAHPDNVYGYGVPDFYSIYSGEAKRE